MKKGFLAGLFVSSTAATAGASTYIGEIGPFFDHKITSESLEVTSCVPQTRQLLFSVRKAGKYHMPKIAVERLILHFQDHQRVLEAHEIRGYRYFAIDLNQQFGCPSRITLKGRNSGFNPGHSNYVYIDVEAQ